MLRSDRGAGVWAEELAGSCEAFRKTGFEFATASVSSDHFSVDRALLDPALAGQEQAAAFSQEVKSMHPLPHSRQMRGRQVADHAAALVVGGHGVRWEPADSTADPPVKILRASAETCSVV